MERERLPRASRPRLPQQVLGTRGGRASPRPRGPRAPCHPSLPAMHPVGVLCSSEAKRADGPLFVPRTWLIPRSPLWPVLFSVLGASRVPRAQPSILGSGAGGRAKVGQPDHIQPAKEQGQTAGGADPNGFEGQAKKFGQGSFGIQAESPEVPSPPPAAPRAVRGTQGVLNRCLYPFEMRTPVLNGGVGLCCPLLVSGSEAFGKETQRDRF